MKPIFLKLTKVTDDEPTPVIININNFDFAYPWDGRMGGTFIKMLGGAIIVKEDISELEALLKEALKEADDERFNTH